jgi:hypothetical protein
LGCGEIKPTDSAWQTRIEPISIKKIDAGDGVAMRDHAIRASRRSRTAGRFETITRGGDAAFDHWLTYVEGA